MKLGIDRLNEFKDVFGDKRVGLITNPTGVTSSLESSIDFLQKNINLVALYSPEHGIRGAAQAGDHCDSELDEKSGLYAYSLYGEHRHPSKEMMDIIDIMAIDIQDGGSRFYTFIYTMAYAMMACKEYNKKFVVFDRPNPAGCYAYEGNILDLEYRSFVGYYPMVQRHGMTIGELAKLFNEEYGIGCDLTVIPMEGYTRDMEYEQTGKIWVVPSPNFPTVNTAFVYNATCIFEGTNISEGRGTTIPFQVCGAPWIDANKLADIMNGYHFEGVYFRPMYFTPTFSKHQGKLCGGVELHVLDRKTFKPVHVSWTLFDVVRHTWPEEFQVTKPYREGAHCMLELETGFDRIYKDTISHEEEMALLDKDTETFGKIRAKYLMY